MNELKKKRKSLSISQKQASNACGVSLRTYQTYEELDVNNETYRQLLQKLNEMGIIDGTNYLLSQKAIKNTCRHLFKEKYPEIVSAYLYGSYALNQANGKSNVNIMIILSRPLGKKLESINKQLSKLLHKEVEVKMIDELFENPKIIKKIFIEGIKIY